MKHRERLSQFNLAMVVGLVVLIILASVACNSEKQAELEAIEEYKNMMWAWLEIESHFSLREGAYQQSANLALKNVLTHMDYPTYGKEHLLLITTYSTHVRAEEHARLTEVEAQKSENRFSDHVVHCFNVLNHPDLFSITNTDLDDHQQACELSEDANLAFLASKMAYWDLENSPVNVPFPNSITSESSIFGFIQRALPLEVVNEIKRTPSGYIESSVWENVMDELVTSLANMRAEYCSTDGCD